MILLETGELYCVGAGASCGVNIAPEITNYPRVVAPRKILDNVGSVSNQLRIVCALLLDGTLKCWGSNNYGQLGRGSTTNAYDVGPDIALGDEFELVASYDVDRGKCITRTTTCPDFQSVIVGDALTDNVCEWTTPQSDESTASLSEELDIGNDQDTAQKVVDVNLDGVLDVIYYRYGSKYAAGTNSLQVYLNVGSNQFPTYNLYVSYQPPTLSKTSLQKILTTMES